MCVVLNLLNVWWGGQFGYQHIADQTEGEKGEGEKVYRREHPASELLRAAAKSRDAWTLALQRR